MKVTPRFTIRAALVLGAAGIIGAFGACKDDPVEPTPPPPPPPPPAMAAPSGLTATPTANSVALGWTDNSTNETGFRVERCSGPGCTNFAQIGTNTAADVVVFNDTGLTASTAYSYRVRAFNATDSSAFSATVTATTLAGTVTPVSPIFIGAGEISTCLSSAGPTGTAAIIQSMLSDTNVTVFSAGEALSDPAAPNFDCFDTKWGSFKDRTIFALGTGDYNGRGAAAVYSYFGNRTGPPGKGYFSFDKGTWHIVVLNTTSYELGVPEIRDAGTEFNNWLAADLAATTKPCIMAISWERRLYTSESGTLGRQGNMNTIARTLYAAGVDVLVSANDHVYERFPQTDPDGVVDAAQGFRQFIVGTGGMTTWSIKTPNPNPPAGLRTSNVEKQGNVWGLLKLTLDPASYKWEFVPVTTGAFADTGETACH
jgi:hypothetical protein